jgi:AAHS family 4-hydroxybenzoate transporter-like MFS transporter
MSKSGTQLLDVAGVLDRRISPYQIWIFAFCFLLSFIDGLDSQIASVTVSMIARDMALDAKAIGPLLAASQFGSLVGALTLGWCGDRFGRRPTIIVCMALLALTTFLTAHASSLPVLIALRFLTGLGVGGALPCYLALSAEFSPVRYRATIISIVFCAVPCGGIVIGILAAALLGSHGWQFLYFLCSGLTLAMFVAALLWLPESPALLIASGNAQAGVRKIMRRVIGGGAPMDDVEFTTSTPQGKARQSIGRLFSDSRTAFTVLLWMAFYLSYAVIIGSLVWTPGLMKQAGMSVSEGSILLSLFNFGGVVGILVGGQLADRARGSFSAILAVLFLIGAGALALLGAGGHGMVLASLWATAAGLLLTAGQAGIYSLAGLVYPLSARSTGIGWGSAMGRVGAATGPLFVGAMVSAGWSVPMTYAGVAVLALVNVPVLVLIHTTVKRRKLLSVQEAPAGAVPAAQST